MGMGTKNGLSLLCIGLLALSFVSIVYSHDADFDDAPETLEKDPEVTIEDVVEPEFKVEYLTPVPSGPVYFAEHFDDFDAARKRWIISRAHKADQDNVFKYDGQWDFDLPERVIFPNDRGLILRSKAKHAAISAKLDRRFDFNTKPLYVQYEVNFQNGMDCGGAYIKLLSHSKDLDLNNFHDKTPYTIMFGPDKCGNDIKLHFIFRHKNPINGTFEEKHSKRPSNRMEETYSDKKPHLYRLVLTPDNKFEVYVDDVRVNRGSLLSDMTPPINPPEEIEDPNDRKPADWDEREKIPDNTASKPEDWDEDAPAKIADPSAVKPDGWLEDEPEMVVDTSAVKPEDWDESMDGTWEPPLIPNPNCEAAPGCGPWSAPLIENPAFKGKWKPPMIPNPNFKGKWTPRKIPNPNFFEDKEPFKMTPISAVGLELWAMTEAVLFDNFIITDDENILEDWTAQTYGKKKLAIDRDSNTWWGKLMRKMNYRVGAWSAYFVYCAAPIILYFGYLLKLCIEEGYISRIIKYSNAHPWLWAVYIVLIGLPLVLIFTFCCSQEKKQLEDHKKTDATVEDDDVAEERKRPKTTIASEATRRQGKTQVSTSREELEIKKLDSDDESDPEDDGSVEAEAEDIGDTEKSVTRAATLKGSGSKNIIDLNAAEEVLDTGAGTGDAPRKRRARKE